jgi:hypothetical protein
MIASYNASAVTFYNATGGQVRFENINIFYQFLKMLHPTTTWALG